ncbi:MAG: DegT/DnrJ/EryC1/StrS family aminotransferase [Bacteroidales bacterium]|jgi:dTDP-4-amino-4,6-dideoxygalactose transaminase|nr:DegT/DnrJ/EryC1/StrS family aminotransferase [Bacteroidales bacterium]
MDNIQMVDLANQYNKIKNEIDTAIQEVIDSTAFVKGTKVKEFEANMARFLDVKHVISVGNGTDALQIALMSLDLKLGDEVIVPDFTFIASAEVVALLGLTPVFADVNYETFNINPSSIKKAISPKTKAIIPVHLFGQGAEMEEINKIAKEYNLYVVEDNAQAIGADYCFRDGQRKKLGTIGDIGCTSFFPSKNLGCFGDGGAIFTNDDKLAEKIRTIANHGMKERYYHDMLGVNSRLDTLQAAVLDVKLKYLDNYCSSRFNAAMYYNEALANVNGVVTPALSEFTTHVFHQYTLKISNGKRNELRAFLSDRQIPAMIYYPVPLHKQKVFSFSAHVGDAMTVSDALADEVLSLPMHTELTTQQDYIIGVIKEFFS